MTFKQRLKLYLMGFAMGLAILSIILGKKGGCAGGSLGQRKLSELMTQEWKISEKMQCKLNCIGLANMTLFKAALKTSTVNYDKSEPHAEPCGKWIVESAKGSKLNFTLLVQDCQTTAEILDITFDKSCDCK
ncbi:MAG: hypothetical protein ACXVNR_01120 [Bacteroidia bacterium]